MDNTKNPNEEVITNLLQEFKEQRESIKNMIEDIEKLQENIDTIFPQSLDKRYTRFFEEKVKTITGFFNVLLDMRKEITKSIKDEIEIRRRLTKDDIGESGTIEDLLDIRKIAKKVETFKKQSEKISEDVAA